MSEQVNLVSVGCRETWFCFILFGMHGIFISFGVIMGLIMAEKLFIVLDKDVAQHWIQT